jgi:hypothetical protein
VRYLKFELGRSYHRELYCLSHAVNCTDEGQGINQSMAETIPFTEQSSSSCRRVFVMQDIANSTSR